MRNTQVWGMMLILAGLAMVATFFSEAIGASTSVSTKPVVMLSPEPTQVWPGQLLQVSSVPLEETETRGGEDAQVDLPSLPRLPSSNALGQSLVLSPLQKRGESEGAAEPSASPHRLFSASPLLGWPVVGEITQGFGCSAYYTGLVGPGCPAETPWFHDGLDIGAEYGTPVRAALTGTVLFAGPDESGPRCNGGYHGYGLAVVVDNGAGWQALYAHLSQVQVFTGQVVTPETILGQVGATGCVSGAHLHFGLRYRGTLVNPVEWQE